MKMSVLEFSADLAEKIVAKNHENDMESIFVEAENGDLVFKYHIQDEYNDVLNSIQEFIYENNITKLTQD